jgi:hypothetical protein
MYRSVDARRSLPETITRQARMLGDQTRAQGRGAPALRSAAGHVVELVADSQAPLLLPRLAGGTALDVGLRFDNGGVAVTDGAGGDTRDWSVRNHHATGTSTVDGASTVNGGSTVNGDATTTGRHYVDNLSLTGNSVWSVAYDGAVRWHADGGFDVCSRDGSQYHGVRASAFAVTTPSWREMKTNLRPIEEHLGVAARRVIDDLELCAWEYDPGHPDVTDELAASGTHIAPMLDEMPAGLCRRHVLVDDAGAEHVVDTWDREDMLGVALATIQDLSAEVRALRAEVTGLRPDPSQQ